MSISHNEKSDESSRYKLWLTTLVKNSGWTSLALVARALEILVRSIIVARLLSVEDFGAYVVVLAFVGLVSELANLNFESVVMAFGARHQEAGHQQQLGALFKLGYLATLAVALLAGVLVAALLAISYNTFIEQAGLYTPAVLLGFATTFSMLEATNKASLRLLNYFRAIAIVDIVMVIVNLSFIYVFLHNVPATPSNAIFAMAVCLVFGGLLTTIVALTIISKTVPGWWQFPSSSLSKDVRPMLKMALGNSMSMSMRRMLLKSDVLLLAALAPGTAVGLYDIGKKLAAFVLIARDALALAAFPQIGATIAAGHYGDLRILLTRQFKFGIPMALIIFGLVWYLAPLVVQIAYGERYAPSAQILTILALSSILQMLFFWSNGLLLNARRVKAQIVAHAVGLSTMFAFGALFIPVWQAQGMAWAVVIASVLHLTVVSRVAWQVLFSNQTEQGENALSGR